MSDVYLWDTYHNVGSAALERGDLEQALESFKAAVTLAESLPSEDPRLIRSLRRLCGVLTLQGQMGQAYELLRRAEDLALIRLGADHAETVELKADLAASAKSLGYLDQAEGYWTQVLEEQRRQGDTESFLETMESLGHLAQERERHPDAAEIYAELVESRRAVYGEEHPSVAQALLWQSTALTKSGRAPAAETAMTEAFGLLEHQFADEPVQFAQSLLAGAELMSQGGQIKGALVHQKQALDILMKELDENHGQIWDARELVASSLAGVGQLEEAIELLEYCREHRTEVAEHRRGALLKNLAGLYLATGHQERAEDLYEQASSLLTKSLGPDHPATLATAEERIQLYHFTGRPEKALDLALRTIRATEDRYGPGHPNTAQSYASTAVLAHSAKNWPTAYELMKGAEAIWLELKPQPLDVLANCRLNLATCLIEMAKYSEADAALSLVDIDKFPNLSATVGNLRARLEQLQGEPVSEEAATQQAKAVDDQSEIGSPLEETDEQSHESADGQAETGRSSDLHLPPVENLEQAAPSTAEPSYGPYGVERRLKPRYNLGLNRFFDLTVAAEDEEASIIRSFLVDFSVAGFRVNSERPLPLEQPLKVTLPSDIMGEDLVLKARVIWQRALFDTSFIQGLEIFDTEPHELQQISTVLEKSEPGRGRQHFRLYRPFPIAIQDSQAKDWISSYASDLSLEGLGTRLASQLDTGQEVQVRLQLEFELPTVEVTAVVAWQRSQDSGTSHGLKFASVGPVEAKTIKRYIDRCIELSPEEFL